jgi:hypothetical protein
VSSKTTLPLQKAYDREFDKRLIKTFPFQHGVYELETSDSSSHLVDRNSLSEDNLNCIIAGKCDKITTLNECCLNLHRLMTFHVHDAPVSLKYTGGLYQAVYRELERVAGSSIELLKEDVNVHLEKIIAALVPSLSTLYTIHLPGYPPMLGCLKDLEICGDNNVKVYIEFDDEKVPFALFKAGLESITFLWGCCGKGIRTTLKMQPDGFPEKEGWFAEKECFTPHGGTHVSNEDVCGDERRSIRGHVSSF